jgi:ABC-type Fe3+-siderophore transport system permease subunit
LLATPFIRRFFVLQINARVLNMLQLDEQQAQQLGISVSQLKLTLEMAATLMTAAA